VIVQSPLSRAATTYRAVDGSSAVKVLTKTLAGQRPKAGEEIRPVLSELFRLAQAKIGFDIDQD
jgi:hypothetical protein